LSPAFAALLCGRFISQLPPPESFRGARVIPSTNRQANKKSSYPMKKPSARPALRALMLCLSFALPAGLLPAGDFTVQPGGNLPGVASLDDTGNTITLLGDIDRTGQYTLANKEAVIQSGLADGAAAGINGNGGFRLFDVTGGYTWTFDNLIFNNGYTSGNNDGGALRVNGGLGTGTTTFNGDFQIKNSTAGRHGGAIASTGGAISNLWIFGGNVAFAGNTAATHGGAINAPGDLIFEGSAKFEFNTSGSRGGALYANGTTTVFKGDALFASNTSGADWGGGAITAAQGAGMLIFEKTSTFTNNTSAGPEGGAIHARGGAEFKGHAWFSGNKTTGGGGGAVFARTLALSFGMGVTATGNSAALEGGALNARGDLYIGGNSEFIGNTAGGNGGAIFIYSFTTAVTLDATDGGITFKDNRHQTSTTAAANAIVFRMGSSAGYDLNLVTGTVTGAAGDIRFYDPLAGSSNNGAVTVTQTGPGAVVYDTHASTLRMNTTVESGTLKLTRGASYGHAAGFGSFTLAPGAVLAGNGAILAQDIDLQPGSTLEVLGGGALVLGHDAAFAGAAGLVLAGSGTIDAGGALSAAAVRVGTLTPDDPGGAPALVPSPGTLAFTAATPLTIERGGVIHIDLFDGGAAGLLQAASLAVTGSAFLDLAGSGSGSYKVISAGADISALDLVTLVNGRTPTARHTAARRYENGGAEVWYDFEAKNLALAWAGPPDGGVWKNSASSDANWTDGAALNEETYFQTGDRVAFTDAGAGGAAAVAVSIDGAGGVVADMTVNAAADYTFAGAGGITTGTTASSGLAAPATGRLVKDGTGVLAFANDGANTFAGGIEIRAGAIAFTGGGQLGGGGAGAAAITVAAGASGTLRPGDGADFANPLAPGAGARAAIEVAAGAATWRGTLGAATPAEVFAKTGAGALTLAAGNAAFTGSTAVEAGALYLAPGASLGGAVGVAPGAVFGGGGTAAGGVSAAAGGVIEIGAPGAAAGQTLTLASLALDGSRLLFDLFDADAAGGGGYRDSDRLNVAGALTPGAAPAAILIGAFQTGTFNLGNIGALAAAGATASISGGGGSRQSVALSTAGADLILTAGGDLSRVLAWTGSAGADWNSAQTNWTDGGEIEEFAGGDRVIFDGATDGPGAGRRVIAINDGTVRVADMRVEGAADYEFTGAHGIHAAASNVVRVSGSALVDNPDGRLVKTGAGALVFSNSADNTFTGGIEIAGGTLAFSRAGHLGDGGNGILFSGDGALRADADGLAPLANTLAIAGGKTAVLDTQGHAVTLAGALAAAPAGATLVKAGAGALTLTADSSAFAGLTVVAGGTLRLDGARLGGAADVAPGAVFGGSGVVAGAVGAGAGATIVVDGALAVAGLQFTGPGALAGSGTLSAASLALGPATDGTLTVDVAENAALTLAGAVFAGAGRLEKTGAGALALEATSGGAALAGIRVGAGTLATSWLAGAVENAGAIVLTQTADAVYSGTLGGGGAFAKQGDFELAVTGAIASAGAFEVRAGRLTLAGGAPLAAGAFSLAQGAELRVTGASVMNVASFAHAGVIKIGAAAGGAAFGKLTINSAAAVTGGGEIHLGLGRFTADGIEGYDKLVLNTPGAAAGPLTVHFSQASADPIPAGQSLPDDIITGAGVSGVVQDGWLEYGHLKYTWTPDADGAKGAWSGALIDTINAAAGVDAASLLLGRASIDSLSRRLLASRHARRAGADFEVWLDGLYHGDRINKKLYGGSDVRIHGMQAGAGISRSSGDGSVALGVFYDRARAVMDQADGMSGTTTDADAYGVYGAVRLGRWHVDVIARNAHETHGIDVRRRPRMDARGDSFSTSVEAGVVLDDMSGVFFWEPQAQLVFQRHRTDPCADFAGRVYDIAAADSLEGRLGVRAWLEREWRRGLKLTPWLRAGAVHEFRGATRVTVAGEPFENDLGGMRGTADAGLAMQLGRGFALNAVASWYYGEIVSGHSLNLGLSRAW
jgi:outer membrane autotransporter protein